MRVLPGRARRKPAFGRLAWLVRARGRRCGRPARAENPPARTLLRAPAPPAKTCFELGKTPSSKQNQRFYWFLRTNTGAVNTMWVSLQLSMAARTHSG